ncbi:hypothetical protein COBT_002561, partial [Conglomerata obtusa]
HTLLIRPDPSTTDPYYIDAQHEILPTDRQLQELETDEPRSSTISNFFKYIYENFINIQLTKRHTYRLCKWMLITNLFFLIVFLYNKEKKFFKASEMHDINSLFIVFWFIDILSIFMFYVNFYIFDKNQVNRNSDDDDGG